MAQRNHFELPEQLKPTEVYPAAVGMMQELVEGGNFELLHIVHSENYQGTTEIGRVYKNITDYPYKLHILYYPGRDISAKQLNTAYPLKDIIADVDSELSKIANGELPASEAGPQKITDNDLKDAHKHFIVAESGRYGLRKQVNHFIYAMREKDHLITEDSIKRRYNQKDVEIAIMGDNKNFTKEPFRYDWQNQVLDTWQCGHYSLQALHRRTHGTALPQPNFFQKHPRVKYGLIALAVVLGIAGIVAASVATFGLLPAVLVPTGFAVGGFLALSGMGLGITLKLLINKFKLIARPSEITPEIQSENHQYYQSGKAAIEKKAAKKPDEAKDSLLTDFPSDNESDLNNQKPASKNGHQGSLGHPHTVFGGRNPELDGAPVTLPSPSPRKGNTSRDSE